MMLDSLQALNCSETVLAYLLKKFIRILDS